MMSRYGTAWAMHGLLGDWFLSPGRGRVDQCRGGTFALHGRGQVGHARADVHTKNPQPFQRGENPAARLLVIAICLDVPQMLMCQLGSLVRV